MHFGHIFIVHFFICVIDYAKEKKTIGGWLSATAIGLIICFLSMTLPNLLEGTTNFYIDYGIWGILLPVIIYLTSDAYKILATTLALVPICLELGGIQWWCMAAVALLAFYSGKRGKANIKNLFYIYYPAHLVGIYLISLFAEM